MISFNAFSILDLLAVIVSATVLVVFLNRYFRLTRKHTDLLFCVTILFLLIHCVLIFLADNAVAAGTPAASVPNGAGFALLLFRLLYANGTLALAAILHLALRYLQNEGPLARHIPWLYIAGLLITPLYWSDLLLEPLPEPLASTSSWTCVTPWQPRAGVLSSLFGLLWITANVYLQYLWWRASRANVSNQPNAIHPGIVWAGFTVWAVAGLTELIESMCHYVAIEISTPILTLGMLVLAVGMAEEHARSEQRRRLAEASLQQSQAELKEAQRLARVGSWAWTEATGQEFWSEQLYHIAGLDPTKPPPRGEAREQMYTPQSWVDLKNAVKNCLTTGQSYELDLELIRTDGAKRWITCRGEAERDNSGRTAKIRGTAQDITERKRAEQEQVRLLTAMEQAAETILITDNQSRIVYVNPAFEKVTGYTRQEVLGQKPSILKSGRHDSSFYQQMWATLSGGNVWQGRLVNRSKSGTIFEEEATISPVRDPAGAIVNFVSVKRDVTHEAHLETQLRQAQKMEVIGRLAGGIAHDFNNLLTVIIAYSDLALREISSDHPLLTHLEEIKAAGTRAATLTRQLLAFSRKQILLPQVLDINDLVRNLTKMLCRLIGEDIRLTTSFHPKPGRVKADLSQMEQAIINLAVNARDAMPDGGELSIETAPLERTNEDAHNDIPPGQYVVITIIDTGVGMTSEVKAHIFEPFFTTKELGKGTGLGLSTVYGIVKQSGGHITFTSEPGHGTKFHIYLPRFEENTWRQIEADQKNEPKIPHGTETILLVEDADAVRDIARHILTKQGYRVLEAATGHAALDIADAQNEPIHLLLADVVMPGMNGRLLAETLNTKYRGIKVLIMSGYAPSEGSNPKQPFERFPFIKKPFSVESLALKVREVLDTPTVSNHSDLV